MAGFGFEDLVVNLVLLLAGLLVGIGFAKILKGLLLIVLALAILFLLGFTVAGIVAPQTIASLFGPAKQLALQFLTLLAKYPTLSMGLLIGLVIGALR
jgi:glucan phosphoethanolaminetransferase (alkaline phosphatase superfamily)